MTDALPEAAAWIRVRDLGFAHGAFHALRGVSLDLYPGRHYVVAGPNGAGKSTLLDILSGLKRPGDGTVAVHGRDISLYSPGDFARILALAPQDFRLDFSFTVRELVAMGRRPHLDRWGRLDGDDIEIVDQALRDAHLETVANKAVTALSGGERKRCIIARALAQATPILLLDEPDSGLDIAQALSVMALARKLADNGSLVVSVSHDLNLAARYGHEFIFLKNGLLAATGPVEKVFVAEILAKIYETDAQVGRDAFTGAPAVSFRARGDSLS